MKLYTSAHCHPFGKAISKSCIKLFDFPTYPESTFSSKTLSKTAHMVLSGPFTCTGLYKLKKGSLMNGVSSAFRASFQDYSNGNMNCGRDLLVCWRSKVDSSPMHMPDIFETPDEAGSNAVQFLEIVSIYPWGE